MFIIEQLVQVYTELFSEAWWVRYLVCAFTLMLLIIIFPWLNGRTLSYLSMLSLIAIMVSSVIIIVYLSQAMVDGQSNIIVKQFKYQGIPYYFGIVFFMYEGNPQALMIEGSLKKPK